MKSLRLPMTSVVALAAACAVPAQAQDLAAAQDSAAEQAPPASNEIIVTSTRRSESLQNVPASITAFTSQAIEAKGIERPSDFIALTPNVSLVEVQNAGFSFVIIRGISQNRNSEPSVAVVVDGVQQINPAQFNQELVDIEQIEVLKGPQGGLYGRNAIGGAIIIRSKQPTDELSGKITAGIDNGFGYYLRGNMSGPVAENLKFRVAGSWYDTKGFIRNTFLGEDADPVEDFNLRGNLLWTPTPELTLDLRGSIGQLRTQGLYYNIVNDVNDTSLPVRVNNAGQNDRDLSNIALRISHESDIGTFASVTSYDTVEEILTGDAFDFLPAPDSFFFNLFESIFGAGNGFDLNQSQYLDVKAFSQELRYESPADKPLQVIAGGYLVDTERFISVGNMVDTGSGVFPVFREPTTNPLNPQFSFLADGQENFAWALFGNAVWKINEQLRFDASLRYDRDKRRNTTLTPTAFLPNIAGFPEGETGEVRRRVFDSWQPKATLTYKPVEEVTLFGGWSRGFRSGGFNQTGVGAVAAANGIVGVNDIFEAEIAETFEIGVKTRTPDRDLTFNVSAFTTQSENSYFFVFLAANSTQNLGNVPRSRLKGFEVDATWHATDSLDLSVGYGYTDSAIRAFEDASVLGNKLPGVSRSTFNFAAQYQTEVAEGVDLVARADYRNTGRTWWDLANSTSRDPVDIVDTRISLEQDGWKLSAFAQNLFDEDYNTEFSPGGFVWKGRPRRYGAEISFSF